MSDAPLLTSLPDDDRRLLRRSSRPAWMPPMLATLTDERFSSPDWIFERKLDGERCVALCDREDVRLLTRNQKSAASAYPEVVDALRAGGLDDVVLDGEVVAFEHGQTSFARLQGRMQISDPETARRSGISVFYYVFDILQADGYDLRQLPLHRRKTLLREAVEFADPIRTTTYRVEDGEDFHREACARGWEGVIAKRSDAPYHAGRSRDWLKFKCVRGQELVIAGFTQPRGTREGLGALLLGYYDGSRLCYAGKVGTGFSRKVLRDLRRELDAIRVDDRPYRENLDALPRESVQWVEPKLVAEIGFTEWTTDGLLRHPRYQGLRRDKAASEVVREEE